MNKVIFVFGIALFALIVLYPTGALLLTCIGYSFSIVNIMEFAVTAALIAVAETVMCLVCGSRCICRSVSRLFSLSVPVSLAVSAMIFMKSSSPTVICCSVILLGCTCFVSVKYGVSDALKATCIAMAALMTVPVFFIVLFHAVFGDMSANTVVKTLYSPEETYYAQVIDSDQGALGGNTIVEVCENRSIKIAFFEITKRPDRVYLGNWGEHENINIYWKNEHCLVINSTEYDVD